MELVEKYLQQKVYMPFGEMRFNSIGECQESLYNADYLIRLASYAKQGTVHVYRGNEELKEDYHYCISYGKRGTTIIFQGENSEELREGLLNIIYEGYELKGE
jgi:hypothetical protein